MTYRPCPGNHGTWKTIPTCGHCSRTFTPAELAAGQERFYSLRFGKDSVPCLPFHAVRMTEEDSRRCGKELCSRFDHGREIFKREHYFATFHGRTGLDAAAVALSKCHGYFDSRDVCCYCKGAETAFTVELFKLKLGWHVDASGFLLRAFHPQDPTPAPYCAVEVTHGQA